MNFEINYSQPKDKKAWNDLCLSRDNYVQSTHYDDVQKFYNQVPVYFQIYDNNMQLVAGVKFYFLENKRKFIGKFSRNLLQFGEFLFTNDQLKGEYKTLLEVELQKLLKEKQIVTYIANNFYGDVSLLLAPKSSPTKQALFNVAYVNIDNENLLASFNRNTRRNIKKAEESNLLVELDQNDVDSFLPLLTQIYIQQGNPEGCPNHGYVKNLFKSCAENAEIIRCSHESTPLSTVLNLNFGKSSYSLFGGTLKNDFGSGQFMYYSVMQKLSALGYKKYFFGQIAREVDEQNVKFSVGISTFKRGFSCEEIPSEKNTYILKPTYNTIWNLLVKIFVRN